MRALRPIRRRIVLARTQLSAPCRHSSTRSVRCRWTVTASAATSRCAAWPTACTSRALPLPPQTVCAVISPSVIIITIIITAAQQTLHRHHHHHHHYRRIRVLHPQPRQTVSAATCRGVLPTTFIRPRQAQQRRMCSAHPRDSATQQCSFSARHRLQPPIACAPTAAPASSASTLAWRAIRSTTRCVCPSRRAI